MASVAKRFVEELGENGFKQLLKKYGTTAEEVTEDKLLSIYAAEKRMKRPSSAPSEPSAEEVSAYGDFLTTKSPKDDPTYVEGKAAASLTSDGFQRPSMASGMTPTGMPEIDATDWSKALRPNAEEAKGMLNVDLSTIPGERVEKRGNVIVRSPLAGTAAAAGGLALSSTLGDESLPPPALSAKEEPEQEAPTEMAQGPADGGNAATGERVTPPVLKDFFSSFASSMPKELDLTKFDTRIAGVADQRQSRINELKADILTAKAAADSSSSSIERRELIETLTNAIGQVAAGFYGLKHGLDLSGAKFNKTDWNAKLEQVRAKLKDDIARLTDEQQLDQAVISERKEQLLRQKDDLVKDFELKFNQWRAKGDILGKQQNTAEANARMTFDADKFNAEMRFREQEAIKRAEREGKSAKDQVSAGLKANLIEQDKILEQWNRLATEANSDKLNDEQKRAILSRMEDLDRRYAAARGYPIIASAENPLTPMSYAGLDPDEVVEKAANRFVAQDDLIRKVGAFKNKNALDYVQNPEKYMASFAQSAVAEGVNPVAAAEYAQKEYVKGMQLMFEQQRKFESGLK